MAPRWCYLRRGVAWTALLGCCGAALALAVALDQWPEAAVVLLPALLACCAAGVAFAFDEHAVTVVAVTPRGGGWRQVSRLAVALLPLAVWGAVVLAGPGDLPLDRWAWWSVGAATTALVSGVAALASRREVGTPGSLLASVVSFAVLAPVIVTGFLGWGSVYPLADLAPGAWAFWASVGAGGAVMWVAATRPGPA
ncbi:hypothetical protein NYO98_11225 [Nocardioides sp. STR2]|jgi:hypothetical protein|uniref:ABC-2 type transport system permease protein n=1 Tax=Nocardioides pini TaxID=2975053 RepID=A0ABT4CFF1_9ACTN|nr:hypothetical protein [Nocardioides pini]MCY4726849.1 hypothetical protein [Nocardioides pini]